MQICAAKRAETGGGSPRIKLVRWIVSSDASQIVETHIKAESRGRYRNADVAAQSLSSRFETEDRLSRTTYWDARKCPAIRTQAVLMA